MIINKLNFIKLFQQQFQFTIISCLYFPLTFIFKFMNKFQTKSKRKQLFDEFEQKVSINSQPYAKNKIAFLLNFKSTTAKDEQGIQMSTLLCYFMDQDGNIFKCHIPYNPYFYIEYQQKNDIENQIFQYLEHFRQILEKKVVQMIDLDQKNHLSGKMKKYIKLSFRLVSQLLKVRSALLDVISQNKIKQKRYIMNTEQYIKNIRQYDVLYHSRVCIDKKIRSGKWFLLNIKNSFVQQINSYHRETIPHIRIMSFDIQTSKKPLRFPDAQEDQIMMISFTYQGQSFLIVNTGFCKHPCRQFQYKPKEKLQYSSYVTVYNCPSEKSLLQKFYQELQDYRPSIIVSFNGDRFDWPYIEKRAQKNKLSFSQQVGVIKFMIHMDCFYWVERDAYLPQGSHGLKAVTKAKLDYCPIEVDPQMMVPLALSNTQQLAQYSISDSVATYHLYKKHIHDFIFALCTIIPMSPDDVLRKGSGTLCQNLLMAQAYDRGIIFPNKTVENHQKFYKGHLIDSQTYIGGKVQCLRSGVFREDITNQFAFKKQAFQQLIQDIDNLIQFSMKTQCQMQLQQITNYSEIKQTLTKQLNAFVNCQKSRHLPLIYHLDVAAMYPNIILTNRLQPVSVVNNQICAGCLFNKAQNNCKRQLQWQWKGQCFPLLRSQFYDIKFQYQRQIRKSQSKPHEFNRYIKTNSNQTELKKRIKKYCQSNYQKVHISQKEKRKATVCMRQNSFYVDTVRAFRDRRYQLKAKVKLYKNKIKAYIQQQNQLQAQQAQKYRSLYQSLQLAHKIILNSFYGYVMRKGARWYSMQMAAMVTHIGGSIISQAKNWVDKIGIPLQLDTDGIWLLLPKNFPQYFTIKCGSNKFTLSYPCLVLNKLIYQKYCNNQYQVKVNNLQYQIHTEMSIMFQVDGPYRAMIIPAAKQKGKMLKKRYVVFNQAGKITQLKGFQIKRRGELKIIKMFQAQIFQQFLKGESLQQLYDHCAQTARKWLKIIFTKGKQYSNQQMIEHLEQSRILSKQIEEYDKIKGNALTSAKRLKQILKDATSYKKLNCKYLIAKYPIDSPVTQRAMPITIFNSSLQERRKYLRKWFKQSNLSDQDLELRNVLDWDYYLQRLSGTIHKIITIPAFFQTNRNPLPQIKPPDWVIKQKQEKDTNKKQKQLTNWFHKLQKIPQQECVFQKKMPLLITPLKNIQNGQEIQKQNKPSKIINNPYNFDKQFKKWLLEQKKIWDNTQNMQHGQLLKMFKKTDKQLLDSTWQVIQIVQTANLGIYKLWIMSNHRLTSVQLQIPRIIYVSSESFIGGKRLPRQKPQGTRQKIMTQREFQSKKTYFQYMKKAVDAIFQLNVPLELRFLISIGNQCKAHRIKQKSTSQNFVLKQLRQAGNKNSYLEHIHNYFAYIPIIGLKIFTNRLWIIIDPKKKQTHVWIVSKQPIQIRNNKIRQAFNLPDQFKNIAINLFTQLKPCILSIDKYLGSNSSVMLIWCVDTPAKQASKLGLSVLYNNFPVIELQPPVLPQQANAINWQVNCLKAMGQYWMKVDEQLIQKIQRSRYCQLPIGNMQSLQSSLVILLGRLLQQNNQILWYQQYQKLQLKQLIYQQNLISQLESPNYYNYYAMEYDMKFMSLNSIRNIQYITDMDRETARYVDHRKTKDLDQLTTARTYFRILRDLLKTLYDDIIKKESHQADQLFSTFYKWLCSPSNPFYDPFLQKMVQKIINKVFRDLMAYLRIYSITVIYADANKLILTCNKYSFEETQNNIRNSLFQINKLPQFKFLIFQQVKSYSSILLKSKNNYLGMQIQMQKDVQQKIQYLHSNIQMLIPLPLNLQQRIQKCIGMYVQKMNQIRNQQNTLQVDYQKYYQQISKKWIQGEFAETLLKLILIMKNNYQAYENQTAIQEQESQEEEDQELENFIVEDQHNPKKVNTDWKWRRKKLNGSLDNPLQQFVRYLFFLLQVDQIHRMSLIRVKTRCCQLVGLSEFYSNPPQLLQKYLKLSCNNCNSTFQYSYLQKLCPMCNNGIDLGLFMKEVQKGIQNEMIHWQIQDLYCQRCDRVKRQYLGGECQCGGDWKVRGNAQKAVQWLHQQPNLNPYLQQLKLCLL